MKSRPSWDHPLITLVTPRYCQPRRFALLETTHCPRLAVSPCQVWWVSSQIMSNALCLSRLLALPQPGLGHPDQQVHLGPAAAGGGRRRRSHQGGQAGANTAQENQVSGEWAEAHQVYPVIPGAKNKRCYSTTMPALPAHANVNVWSGLDVVILMRFSLPMLHHAFCALPNARLLSSVLALNIKTLFYPSSQPSDFLFHYLLLPLKPWRKYIIINS